MRCQGLRWRTPHLPRPDGRLPPYIQALAAVAHKARQKIAAGEPVLAVGRRDRDDGAVCAGLGVLPRHGGVLAAVGKHLADRRAGNNEIDFRRRYGAVVVGLWRRRGWLNDELSRVKLREGDE